MPDLKCTEFFNTDCVLSLCKGKCKVTLTVGCIELAGRQKDGQREGQIRGYIDTQTDRDIR